MEKMENRLVDMRELYQELKDFDEDNPVSDQRQVSVLIVNYTIIIKCLKSRPS